MTKEVATEQPRQLIEYGIQELEELMEDVIKVMKEVEKASLTQKTLPALFLLSDEDDPEGSQFTRIGQREAALILVRGKLDGTLHELRSAERYLWLRLRLMVLLNLETTQDHKGGYDNLGKTEDSRRDALETLAHNIPTHPYWEVRRLRRVIEDDLKNVNASLAALAKMMDREMDRIKYLEFKRGETYGF